jgi:hypothetical protein
VTTFNEMEPTGSGASYPTPAPPAECGAVCYHDCTTRNGRGVCRCGKCAACGWPKHTAIHGPAYGQGRGSKPVGHEFQPEATHDHS